MGGSAGCGVLVFSSNAVTLYHAAQEMAHGGISKRARREPDRGYHWQGIELGRRGAIEGEGERGWRESPVWSELGQAVGCE
jgi:hypothetical protein